MTSAEPVGPMRLRLGFLIPMGVVCAVLAGVVGVAGWIIGGAVVAVGLIAGVAVVAASFGFSSFMIAWAELINPKLILPVGLATYAMKFTVLFLALTLVARSGWTGLRPFAFGVLIGTLVWITAQGWLAWRDKPRLDL